jgi:hypothetical protein
MPVEKKAVHAYLTVESHEAWQRFANANGVSLTSLVEAIGRELMKEAEEAEDHRVDWVRTARRIDALNRLRTRK